VGEGHYSHAQYAMLFFEKAILLKNKCAGCWWIGSHVRQAYTISGPRDVADWHDNGLYSWLIQFPVVSENLSFGYSLEHD
jgi:hypothetical protein